MTRQIAELRCIMILVVYLIWNIVFKRTYSFTAFRGGYAQAFFSGNRIYGTYRG